MTSLPVTKNGRIVGPGEAWTSKKSQSNAESSDELAHFDQVAVGVAHVAADLGPAVDRQGQELRSRALHSSYRAAMSSTRMLRKLETLSGSEGGSSVTVSLSSVGPPPRLI